MVLRTATSASSDSLLEMHILGPAPGQQNQIFWRWGPVICVFTSPSDAFTLMHLTTSAINLRPRGPAVLSYEMQLQWGLKISLHEGTLADFSINVPESIIQMETGLHDRLCRFQKMMLSCCAIWGLFSGICQKSLSSFVCVLNFLEQIKKKSFKT